MPALAQLKAGFSRRWHTLGTVACAKRCKIQLTAANRSNVTNRNEKAANPCRLRLSVVVLAVP